MSNRITVLLVLFVVAGATVSSVALAHAERRTDTSRVVPGQYIVVFKDSVADTAAAEQDIVARARGERLLSYQYALRGFSARFSEAQVQAVRNDPRVAFVSEDREITIADVRTDASTRGRRSTPPPPMPPPPLPAPSPSPAPTPAPVPPASTQVLPMGVDRINAERKANLGAGVQVAVIDTGIDVNHPDLKANIAGGKNCLSSNASDYADQNGHGTHVAGTIAAADNTEGVVGVAPGAKLWAVRVLDKNGSGTWSSVICGLDFVASQGPANGGPITVANMSLGGGGTSDNNCGATNSDALHAAVCRVRDAGVTIVVAAGNDGVNASGFVPAAYDDAVITVSALADSDGKPGGLGAGTSYGADDTFATFSNWGNAVDVGAPGVAIYSTKLGGGYQTMSGTSMASPHAAGAAALYLASHVGSTWTAVRDALIVAGEPAGSGHTGVSPHLEPVLNAGAL